MCCLRFFFSSFRERFVVLVRNGGCVTEGRARLLLVAGIKSVFSSGVHGDLVSECVSGVCVCVCVSERSEVRWGEVGWTRTDTACKQGEMDGGGDTRQLVSLSLSLGLICDV